ncbi:Uncharacterised protein [Mycobacterium tuberculosis]|nr:Uncharacterised protein [Mycobacterium tuberculosis]
MLSRDCPAIYPQDLNLDFSSIIKFIILRVTLSKQSQLTIIVNLDIIWIGDFKRNIIDGF